MNVVLLAAGRSKRLKPIEDKNFLKFLGKPLIQHQLEQLAEAGFNDFVVIGGVHNMDRLAELAKTLPYNIHVREQENLDDGMAGAVMASEEAVKEGPLLIVSGNDVVDIEAFRALMDGQSDNNDIDGFLVAKEMDSYFPGGYLELKDGLIQNIVEKPGAGNEPGNLVNLVIHYFRDARPLFDALHKVSSDRDDRYEVALDTLIKCGLKLKAVPYSGFWQPIKYPWHVLTVMEHFLARIPEIYPKGHIGGDTADVAESAVIRGDVYLEEGVKVFDHATIVGPAYIGKNVIIANNALVRGCDIGDNSVVGYATEAARSYWGDSVWTHSNYVGDSILGDNVSFGTGSVTGNLRFDEGNICVDIQGEKLSSGRNKFGLITGDHVRCGVNTSFMPGIKIGKNVCIAAGIIIGEDIEDDTFVTGKTELKKYKNTLDVAGINREEMKKKLQ